MMKNLKRWIYLKFARRMGHSNENVSVPSIISDNAQVKGNLSSSGIIHVDGRLLGDIDCDELVIGLRGIVKGNVKVQKLYIYGMLEGTADVDYLFVAKSAKLIGDAAHCSIAIEPGAFIDGHCTRKNSSSETAAAVNPALVSHSRKSSRVVG